MAVTVIDPHSALIVVDLQNGARNPTVHPLDGVIANVAELAAVFRSAGQTVVLVTYLGGPSGRSDAARARAGAPAQTPPDGWNQLVPELAPQPDDLQLTKTGWGSFTGTALDEILRERGVTQVVLTGIATSLGVESTAREAKDRGYNVVFAVDAMTDLNPAAHEGSLGWSFPIIGEVGTTAEILALV
jgi:nicotinamidase-related amidase